MKRTGRTLLAFDYGKKQIGVAVGQELTGSSSPLETVRTMDERPDWDAITHLIEAWQPDALVVGIPLNMDGTEQEMTRAARRFAHHLGARYRLPVHHADERLTTIEAARIMSGTEEDSGTKRSRRRRSLDEVAAHIILQTFLSQHRTEVDHGADSDPEADEGGNSL